VPVPAAARVAGQESDRRRRAAHEKQRREKSELSSDPVAKPAEEESTEWPHGKANRKGGESLEEIGRGISSRIKLSRDDRCKTSEDEEVVPLDHGAGSGCGNYSPYAGCRSQ